MFIASFCCKSLIWVLVSFLSLLVPWIFCFISFWVSFILSFFDQAQLVLWAFWLPGLWTLHQIGWLSPHHLVIFLRFCCVLSFGPYFFVLVHMLHSKGRSLRYSPGQGNSPLWCCMWGRVLRGNSSTCSALGRLSVTPPHYPQAKWAIMVLIPRWVGLCTF